MTKPHPNNACAAAYTDWLEVHLLPECNAKCVWCVESDGFCPDEKAEWTDLVVAIKEHDATNIILLGGEPTLHPNVGDIIDALSEYGKKVWLTTNGSMLTPVFVRQKLRNLTGLNISIHHHERNHEITGIDLDFDNMVESIEVLHDYEVEIRLNCNCIKGYIDSARAMRQFVTYAFGLGADKVRFAELKVADGDFIDLIELCQDLGHTLPDEPYTGGCSTDIKIGCMPVNIRTMCGFQTPHRSKPVNPVQHCKDVMYRDGQLYNGWQKLAGKSLNAYELTELFRQVANGEIAADQAAEIVTQMKTRLVTAGS